MTAPMPTANAYTDPLLLVELKAMQQFLHLAPVGLVRADRGGDLLLMNPHAARLMAPLLMQHAMATDAVAAGQGADGAEEVPVNLFDLLEPLNPGLRDLVGSYARSAGIICENYRINYPGSIYQAGGPEALGITLLKLSDDDECLMAVVTDQSSALLLERLQLQANA